LHVQAADTALEVGQLRVQLAVKEQALRASQRAGATFATPSKEDEAGTCLLSTPKAASHAMPAAELSMLTPAAAAAVQAVQSTLAGLLSPPGPWPGHSTREGPPGTPMTPGSCASRVTTLEQAAVQATHQVSAALGLSCACNHSWFSIFTTGTVFMICTAAACLRQVAQLSLPRLQSQGWLQQPQARSHLWKGKKLCSPQALLLSARWAVGDPRARPQCHASCV
jgi:hypothetical protein